MNDDLTQYAVALMVSFARDIEYLTIFEAAEEHLGRDITDSEAQQVERFIRTATITIEADHGTE